MIEIENNHIGLVEECQIEWNGYLVEGAVER